MIQPRFPLLGQSDPLPVKRVAGCHAESKTRPMRKRSSMHGNPCLPWAYDDAFRNPHILILIPMTHHRVHTGKQHPRQFRALPRAHDVLLANYLIRFI